jgi:hypothetical protein
MTGAKIEYEQILESECPPSELLDGTSYEIVSDGYCEESPPEEECGEGEIKYYTCEDGTKIPTCMCENEGWICKISPKEECPDVGPGPETCAAEIKITFNKEVYRIGDPVKIIIEIFDSQGNHLPNYVFYGQMYDDRWHTPDLQKTDDEGYFIHTGTAENPAGGVTEVRFKVYTRDTSSCGSVEDTAEVKFELGVCGMGGCVPEPECKDKIRMCGGKCAPCPEDDEDGDIFYPCNGCELENKCYPYGYRKAGNYCSDENEVFVSQSVDDSSCENNFECKTNLCINGNCVSSNLWNKFLEWIKKIFRGGDDEEPKDCSKILIEKDIGDYEYNQTLYGVSKETHAPLFSDDCEKIGTIKCCVAQYLENGNSGMALMCPYDNREDVENLVRCELGGGDVEEYEGEKVFRITSEPKLMIWTHKNYVLAFGKMPEAGIPEEVAKAYLKKYKSDLGEIDIGDVPPPRPPNSVELCGEMEDNIEGGNCYIDVAISKSDFEICRNIVYDNDHRNKCYINVAEHTGDASICENVDESSLREKCYFWVAEQTGEGDVCEEMEDGSLKSECYVKIAEQTEDASFCVKITDIHIRDKCYRDVAIAINDRSLCEKIMNRFAPLNPKDECYAGTS